MRSEKWPILPHKVKFRFLVGGTMLYYKALIEGLSPLPSADEKLRLEIEEKAQKFGWPALHQELQKN